MKWTEAAEASEFLAQKLWKNSVPDMLNIVYSGALPKMMRDLVYHLGVYPGDHILSIEFAKARETLYEACRYLDENAYLES